MERRSFIRNTGLAFAAAGLSRFTAVAGPFSGNDWHPGLAPANKKLNRQWVESLFERGTATTYSKSAGELQYIGMPVGGICSGALYLGGDGRLWLWDIFNKNQLGAVTKTLPVALEGFNTKEINNVHGSLYLQPATGLRPFEQGFAVTVSNGKSVLAKRLHADDWEEIRFTATYPVATVTYTDKDFPVQVQLQGFSPFIPGDEENSGLPATIQSISVTNHSAEPWTVHITGWLENKTLPDSSDTVHDFKRYNRPFNTPGGKGVLLDCSADNTTIRALPDFGNLALTGLGTGMTTAASLQSRGSHPGLKKLPSESPGRPMAVISTSAILKPSASFHADFIISWYVPNLSFKEIADKGRHYATRFADAGAIAAYIAARFEYLKNTTLLWQKTWYDSSMPWWFMERTFANTSILATTTCHRMSSGRYYAWEGTGCCAGNCLHVWQYAQAPARIFPAAEKDERTRIDLGIALRDDGGISFRAEADHRPAIDGQAGTVLRFYREHQMSRDDSWLKAHWPKIKRTVQFLMDQDKNKDGMEDTPLENTLDAVWRGEIAWIVGLTIAGVRAGQAMAEEMNDTPFAGLCREFVAKGKRNMENDLFNGEYFIHRADPGTGKQEIGSYNTCHIDQVYGQSWAWQVGLGRILDKEKTLSALRALWKYNFMPDVGPYIANHPGGRFYALAGEGGMVMNTNPRNEDKPYGNAKAWQIGYFSECMSGFEHQVAAHLMAEGMTEEALVLTRTIHDRYHAHKRNPFNEIECSDHYARAMASYGTFISACGFTYHGPKASMGFAPAFQKDDFRAPFTAAEGWGTYTQKALANGQVHTITVKHGSLALRQLKLAMIRESQAKQVVVLAGRQKLGTRFTQEDGQLIIDLGKTQTLRIDQPVTVTVS